MTVKEVSIFSVATILDVLISIHLIFTIVVLVHDIVAECGSGFLKFWIRILLESDLISKYFIFFLYFIPYKIFT